MPMLIWWGIVACQEGGNITVGLVSCDMMACIDECCFMQRMHSLSAETDKNVHYFGSMNPYLVQLTRNFSQLKHGIKERLEIM